MLLTSKLTKIFLYNRLVNCGTVPYVFTIIVGHTGRKSSVMTIIAHSERQTYSSRS